MFRRVAVSLAGFVLVCFFLPWIQLSCVGLKERTSGYNLAREESGLLWLVPTLMLAVVAFGLIRLIWARMPFVYAMTCTVGGSITAFLMYREHSDASRASLLAIGWTAWFWLALAASIGVVASGLFFYAKQSRSP